MFGWLKKVWNKGYSASEDGYKFASRSRIERSAIKRDTEKEVFRAACDDLLEGKPVRMGDLLQCSPEIADRIIE